MRSEQVPLQPLVGEETALAFLAVQRRTVVDHLRMDLHFVDPLHMMAQLFQILFFFNLETKFRILKTEKPIETERKFTNFN